MSRSRPSPEAQPPEPSRIASTATHGTPSVLLAPGGAPHARAIRETVVGLGSLRELLQHAEKTRVSLAPAQHAVDAKGILAIAAEPASGAASRGAAPGSEPAAAAAVAPVSREPQPEPAPEPAEAASSEPALFRQAAVEAQRSEAEPVDFRVGVEPKSWGLLLLCASLVAALFAGACLARVEVTAQAPGMLRAPRGLRPIASVIGGSLTEVLVQSGDHVEAGQLVARLEATELRAALVNRQRELETTRTDLTEFEHRDREIEARAIDALQRRRAALKERLEITAQRLVQRRTQAQNFDELVREGSASQTESLTAREALQAASETASTLSADLAQLDLELADRARQATERQSSRRLSLSRAEANYEEAKSLLASTEIHAPAAGQIESLLVSAGSVVEPGNVLANVVPSGAPRTVVAFLPSREIAFVAPGAPATVEVQSLPVSEFGLAKASVARVSSDLATSAEVQSTLGEALSGPLVRVELELVESETSARMQPHLRSGERVLIRLHRRERRLITLLFDFVRKWVS